MPMYEHLTTPAVSDRARSRLDALSRPIKDEAGFSLVEVLTVILLIGIVAAMTIFAVQSAVPSVRGDSAMDSVISAMRLGRDSAITMRRKIEVRFPSTTEIDVVRIDTGSERIIGTSVLESNMSFLLTAGVPDTPDGFGDLDAVTGLPTTAIDFGGAATVRFNEDGTMTDGAGVPLNGTVFIGQLAETRAARAVTITGATGRAQGYAWDGRAWQEK